MVRKSVVGVLVVYSLTFCYLVSQSTDATLTGRITDQSKSAIAGARVVSTNVDTGVQQVVTTGTDGLYNITSLMPGSYKLEIEKAGFRTIVKPDLLLHVQDVATINFEMAVGAASESITVTGGAPLVDTESASVSTVVDRNFAENLPLNGRSFQTLIQLTPGVVPTSTSGGDAGQFSINGQRAASNYWMVDGVSASFGVISFGTPGNGLGGSVPALSAQGGTNSLVSVDALQEFRIQTSTYAPEFGRTPGGQISIVTRSGANQVHGTLFDYFRNDVLDANDWFADANHLPKPKERQNDFGGTFSGPILKDRTFFFFSYEGLRLRLPNTVVTSVPSLSARKNAVPASQPYLDAFPQPTGPDAGNGVAPFSASYSDRSKLDASSIRIDHKLGSKVSLMGRYNYSPSETLQRGSGAATATAPSSVVNTTITTQTVTAGADWVISPRLGNELRVNYSRSNENADASLDNFGGAVPLASAPFPSPYDNQNGTFLYFIFPLGTGLRLGRQSHNLQRQINIVDSLSLQRGHHSVKVGVDFRRLSPLFDPQLYSQFVFFNDVPSAGAGNLSFGIIESSRNATFLFHNLGAFAEDTWRVFPRLTITYGARWDLDFAPSTEMGPGFLAVTGFDLNNLSKLSLAPPGTAPFKTTYDNIAPRLGVAYELTQSQKWQSVLRGGFGVFYDLATSEFGNQLCFCRYPFGGESFIGGGFPLDASQSGPPPITVADLSQPGQQLYAFNPNLQLPYTLQWNVALEQALGTSQTISASYVGSSGRRLLQTAFFPSSPNPNFSAIQLVANTSTSDYDSLQLQFKRRLSHGLQVLASYAWSHSIDTASAGSLFVGANTLVPGESQNANRGPSDFDIRHAFSAASTYDLPAPKINRVANAILGGWAVQSTIQARSAPPLTVADPALSTFLGASTTVRADVVPGQPFYLYGTQYPGGRALNPAAFTSPPTDSGGNPLRQGNLARNALRGFGATQWDFAVHRDFPIRETLKLQFRAEMFNLLNHPSFGPPDSSLGDPLFGQATQTLAQSLAGNNIGGSAFNALYQIGGPRSIQLALKLQF